MNVLINLRIWWERRSYMADLLHFLYASEVVIFYVLSEVVENYLLVRLIKR